METKKQHIGESKLACEFEESTKTASWIGCNLYPDGTVYTKEYTQWLEKRTTSQQQTIERLRELLIIYKDGYDKDHKVPHHIEAEVEKYLNTTELIDQ